MTATPIIRVMPRRVHRPSKAETSTATVSTAMRWGFARGR